MNWWPIGDTFATADDLDALPTLSQGQSDDLKLDETSDQMRRGDRYRWWLARTGPEDGEPFNRRITIERQHLDGSWHALVSYEGRP